MARTVAIGIQDFETIIQNDYFYVDKTNFIKEWWENGDSVTLIARPRRFGKTLTMSMLECFFSVPYADRGDIFEKLSIWQDEKYRSLQGTYPVISLSFANVKETDFDRTYQRICRIIHRLYLQYEYLLEGDRLQESSKEQYQEMLNVLNAAEQTALVDDSLNLLSSLLYEYYGKKVILLMDEYDTPMQEAFVDGYWDELVAFIRALFNASFKTNPCMERAIMTGITRVSKESIFSELNNIKVVTTTSQEYAAAFGFTEAEVFAAMDEQGYANKDEVKAWYDGFTFGNVRDIYNPWSIINFLKEGTLQSYWVNTSSNGLVSSLIRSGNPDIKMEFEELLGGGSLHKSLDEQIVYSQLSQEENAIWSLLVASGYLKMDNVVIYGNTECDLTLTNREVLIMFRGMVKAWFGTAQYEYNCFIKALLKGDRKAMNAYMNTVALETISYFDSGRHPSRTEPERFYHGFVLGLIVELRDRYQITSNRESGFGRYDIMLTPSKQEDDAIIIEFKVFDGEDENSLRDTVQSALQQIEDEKYEESLIAQGIAKESIRKYGFAFQGKRVLIG